MRWYFFFHFLTYFQFSFVQQAKTTFGIENQSPIASTSFLSASPPVDIVPCETSISPSKLAAIKQSAPTVWNAVAGLDHLHELYKFHLVDSKPTGTSLL